MMVDTHTHRWESPDELGPGSARRIRAMDLPPWSRPDATAAAHDRAMDAVDYAFILGLVGRNIGAMIGVEQVEQAVSHRPDKYLGFPGIDPGDDGSLEQLARAAARGMSGVTICPAAQAFRPTDQRPMMLLATCAKRGMPVIVHNTTHLGPAAQGELADPSLFDEALRSHPTLRIVFTEVGAPYPDVTLELIARHANAYADLSGIASRPAALAPLLIAAQARGALGKLLMGSDFPFATPAQITRNILAAHRTVRDAGITLAQLRAIVGRDALACLGIARPAPSATPFDPHHHDNSPDPADAAAGKGDKA
ncbi:MAG: amidohydrolase family protein [Planctomycetes bacterium]|nr:amidohydrolase family protein [Planctomycetota bacterium]